MAEAWPSLTADSRRRVAFLIAGTSNAAFYSQIAALAAGVRQLGWRRWRPSIHAFLGPASSHSTAADWARWAPYLADVRITSLATRTRDDWDNWRQVDAALELAPREADVLVSLDADTLAVADCEDVLDSVADGNLVAGVMAHFPPPGISTRLDWERLADGLIDRPLSCDHAYSLIPSDAPSERRMAPFYVNGGVVFYARPAFERVVPQYLSLRRQVMARVTHEAFTGQIATALAVAAAGLEGRVLPLRYNCPNDPLADRLHPVEANHVVFHHYLRTEYFDRHRLFATRDAYEAFLRLELDPVNHRFQAAVRRVIGSDYPFP